MQVLDVLRSSLLTIVILFLAVRFASLSDPVERLLLLLLKLLPLLQSLLLLIVPLQLRLLRLRLLLLPLL